MDCDTSDQAPPPLLGPDELPINDLNMTEDTATANASSLNENDAASSLSKPDFIMENSRLVLSEISRFMLQYQDPQALTQRLVESYDGTAQHCNILADWLITFAEESAADVKAVIEGSLADCVAAAFDPTAVDESIIRTDDPEAFMTWLTHLVQFREWRDLIYQLTHKFPNCVFLTMAIKEISERGFEEEIKFVPAACSQFTVFCRYLKASLSKILAEQFDVSYEQDVCQFLKMACYGEATYLFTQVLLCNLTLKPRDNKGYVVKRISQELELEAQNQGRDISKYSVQLCAAHNYPKALSALHNMMSKQKLNPADMLSLHELYLQQDQPPVALLRLPLFVQLLTDALFVSNSTLESDYEQAYIHLLACAAAIRERGQSEMSLTQSAIERASGICRRSSKYMMKNVLELMKCLRYPIVAYGVLRFVENLLTDAKTGIDLSQVDQATVYLILIDEAATNHQHLRCRVMTVLCRLFEHQYISLEELSQLDFKMKLIDRFIHLMFVGHVQPVLTYMNSCLKNKQADMSVLRYFVLEVLDMIGPPYSHEFINWFRPLVENQDIYNAIDKKDERDICNSFLKESCNTAACSIGSLSNSNSGKNKSNNDNSSGNNSAGKNNNNVSNHDNSLTTSPSSVQRRTKHR